MRKVCFVIALCTLCLGASSQSFDPWEVFSSAWTQNDFPLSQVSNGNYMFIQRAQSSSISWDGEVLASGLDWDDKAFFAIEFDYALNLVNFELYFGLNYVYGRHATNDGKYLGLAALQGPIVQNGDTIYTPIDPVPQEYGSMLEFDQHGQLLNVYEPLLAFPSSRANIPLEPGHFVLSHSHYGEEAEIMEFEGVVGNSSILQTEDYECRLFGDYDYVNDTLTDYARFDFEDPGTGYGALPLRISQDQNGEYVVFGDRSSTFTVNYTEVFEAQQGEADPFLAKFSSDFELLWLKEFESEGVSRSGLDIQQNGDIICTFQSEFPVVFEGDTVCSVSDTLQFVTTRFNGDGEFQWASPALVTNDFASCLGPTVYQSYLQSDGKGNVYISFPFCGTLQFSDTTVYSEGLNTPNDRSVIFCFNKHGEREFVKTFQSDGFTKPSQLVPHGDQSVLLVAYATQDFEWGEIQNDPQDTANQLFLVVKNDNGYVDTVSGSTFLDLNEDCTIDGSIPSGIIVAQPGNYLTTADNEGNFELPLPEGEFSISTSIPSLGNLEAEPVCLDDVQTVTISAEDIQTEQLDFYFDMNDCSDLDVTAFVGNTVICEPTSVTLRCSNNGPLAASDVSLTVEMPDQILVDSCSHSYALMSMNELEIQLGTMQGFSEESINVWGHVSCNEEFLEDEACLAAFIHPLDECDEESHWDGSQLTIEAYCNNQDEPHFEITNLGSAMEDSTSIWLLQDGILISSFQVQLQAYESITVFGPQTESLLACVAEQAAGFPGEPTATSALQLCYPVDYSNQTSIQDEQGLNSNNHSDFCTNILGAYDPNDKLVTPSGIGSDHCVAPRTRFNYTIRFQNTGNYFATNVRLVDTLSQYLDLSAFEASLSSHDYELELVPKDGRHVLKVYFNEIYLPDSTLDILGSQGFFSYSISAKDSLEEGTRIENHAAIYFDYNNPIITNTVFNTIISEIKNEEWSYSIWPTSIAKNPFEQMLIVPNPTNSISTIYLRDLASLQTPFSIQFFDSGGKEVLRAQLPAARNFSFDTSTWKQGIYIIKITNAHHQPAFGKLFVIK